MASSLKRFKSRALAKPGVRAAYRKLEGEFSFLDAILKARATAGMTQSEIAERIGTTQSAIARLESGALNPTIATLQKYAEAIGYRVDIKLVKVPGKRAARRDSGRRRTG